MPDTPEKELTAIAETPPTSPEKKIHTTEERKNSLEEQDETEEEELLQNQVFEILPPEENNFILEIKNSKSFKNSNAAREITYRAKLKEPNANILFKELLPQLMGLFGTIIDEMKKDYGNEGVARVYIQHPNLERAIIVPPKYLGDLFPDDIIEHVDNVLSSAQEIPADDNIDINIAVVELLKGSGRKQLVNIQEDVKRKRSFIQIVNSDNNCLPRAIVVGLAKLELDENPSSNFHRKKYDRIRKSNYKCQRIEAEKIKREAGIEVNSVGLLCHVPKYEELLKLSITVLSSRIGNKRVYSGSPKYDRKIFLYHSCVNGNEHFDTITKVNGIMCTQYYCEHCDKAFKCKTSHHCQVWCSVCGRNDCKKIEEIKCNDCNQICRSQICLKEHKKKLNGKGKNKDKELMSHCEQFWKCPTCGVRLQTNMREKEKHVCGEVRCKVCEQFHMDSNHKCYMRAFTSNYKPMKIIYYDFESQQVDGVHKPNLLVAQSICSHCENDEMSDTSTCNQCGYRCYLCDTFNKKENEWEKYPCKECGKRQTVFRGLGCDVEFCKWLLHERNKDSTVIAHNARAYDAYFIYDYMMKNGFIPEPAIFQGTKIMYMKVGKGLNIRIIDSLNFLPMALSVLPKSFGLKEKKKGYFPHLFNTPENQNVILPHLPPVEYYDPDGMTYEKRIEFLEWYEKNKMREFDFAREIEEYCKSDVDILLHACTQFRELLKKETGIETTVEDCETLMHKTEYIDSVDAFSYLTIASVCLGIFRSKFLPEEWNILTSEGVKDEKCNHEFLCTCTWLKGRKKNAFTEIEIYENNQWVSKVDFKGKIVKEKFVKSPIGLIPTHGYSGNDNHSKESLQWLCLLENNWKKCNKNVKIQHARCEQGEKVVECKISNRIIKYRVDGYFVYEGEKYACEYYGCNWHGCIKCFPRDRDIIMNDGKSMNQRYQETLVREDRLKKLGFKLITKWSCQFQEDIKNEEINTFVNSLKIEEPINVRDCYFGGRTNALVLHKKFENGERGHYVDFTSLYPDILKYKRFPVGHPQRIIQNFKNLEIEACSDHNCKYGNNCIGFHYKLPYFGVMKVTVLPPKKLIHPILPVRCDNKLKFPLCYRCACENNNEKCLHDVKDRAITHTYCTPEIEVALNEGYELLEIHEVLHWEESEEYDKEKKAGGIFTEYINTFLKLKQQASGYPQNISTDEEKDNYIKNYLNREGILLEKDKIMRNPGLRSLSKLALNSFYGKFGQRNNMKKTKFVTNVGDLFNLMSDPSKEITDFHIMNEDIVEVEFKNAEDFEEISMGTNVVIAAFCTSWARLKLWEVMKRLGSRVLYHDTDSIIYSTSPSDTYYPPLGEYLGDLTDELACKEVGCKVENCEGHWIEEFVSCGPKNYTYKLNTGEITCKVRGFSLNHRNSLIINFNSMKRALYDWFEKKPVQLVTVKTEIRRDKHKPIVYNRIVNKNYGVVYDKRKVCRDMSTVPFGYDSE